MKIQWLAASIAEKNLHYFPYNNSSLEQGVKEEEAKWRGKTICKNIIFVISCIKIIFIF